MSVASIASAATGAVAATAAAQDSGRESWVDEIVVTAQRREEGLQDVPVAVTAIPDNILEDAFVTDVLSLEKLTPALTIDPGPGAARLNLRIRGVGANVFSTAVEPSVSVVLDGVVLARNAGSVFEFDDIERIEVLRGPQGTLFGKNATAGLVNIVTKAPSDEWEWAASAQTELDGPGDNAERYTAGVSGPLSDTAAFRVSAIYRNTPGFLEDIGTGRNVGDQTSWGVRGKLAFEPSDRVSIVLAGDYQENDGEGRPGTQRQSGPLLDLFNGPIVASEDNRTLATLGGYQDDFENAGLSATIEVADVLGDHTFRAISGYRGFDAEDNESVLGIGPLPQVEVNGGPSSYDTYSQEIQLASAPGDIEYTVGALYWRNELDSDFDRTFTNISGGALQLDQGFENTVDTTNLGIYGHGTWRATDRLEATGGLRLIHEDVDVSYENFRTVSVVANGAAVQDSAFDPDDVSTDDTAVTGRLALTYDLDERVSAYAAYARGYKGRAYNLVSDTSQDDLDTPLDPETVDSFELGLRSTVLGGSTIINVTGFYSVFEDFQAQGGVINPDGVVELLLTNAGELETKGIELDVIAQPTDALSLFAGATYTKAEFTDFPAAPCFPGQTEAEGCVGGTQSLDGARLPNAPEFKVSFSGRYQKALGGSGYDGFGTFGYRWQSETQYALDQNPARIQDGFGVADLQLGVVDTARDVELAVFVKNLFDEEYVSFISQNALFGSEGAGDARVLNTTQIVPRDAERIFGVRINKRW